MNRRGGRGRLAWAAEALGWIRGVDALWYNRSRRQVNRTLTGGG